MHGFYDFEVAGVKRSLDPLLQKCEDATTETIRNLLRTRSLKPVGTDERQVLALFVAVQMLRTDAQRQQYKDLNDKIRDAIVRMGGDPNHVEGFRSLTEEESRVETIGMLPRLARELAAHISSGDTQKRPLRYTSKPAIGTDSGH